MLSRPRPLVWGLLIVLALWGAFHSRDLPEVDDADLRARAGSDAAPGDAWSGLLDAAEQGALPELRVAIDRWLGGTDREIPVPEADDAGPSVVVLLDRADEVAGAAESAWAGGDRVAAFDDLERMLELGQKVMLARGAGLLETAAAARVQGIAFDRIERWVEASALTGADRARLQQLANAHALPVDRWDRIWAAEYESLRALAFASSAGVGSDSGIPGFLTDRASYFYHPNRTLQTLSALYRETGEAYQAPCGREPSPPSPPEVGWLTYVAPNAVGRVLISFAVADGTGVRRTLCSHVERAGDVAARLAAPGR